MKRYRIKKKPTNCISHVYVTRRSLWCYELTFWVCVQCGHVKPKSASTPRLTTYGEIATLTGKRE